MPYASGVYTAQWQAAHRIVVDLLIESHKRRSAGAKTSLFGSSVVQVHFCSFLCAIALAASWAFPAASTATWSRGAAAAAAA